MADIVFHYTAEGKQLASENAKLKKQFEEFREEMGKTGRSAKNSFGSVSKELTTVASHLIGPVGVSSAIMTLVASVKDAYAKMKEEHRGFMQTLGNTSDAQNRFIYNAASTIPGGKEGAEAMAKRVSAASGLELRRVYDIGATAVSAAGAATPETIESAMTEGARLERLGVGEGSALAGRALDLAVATGKQDAQANFAFLRQIGASARVVDITAQGNLVPAIYAGTQAGDSPEEAGELVAGMNSLGKDPEGRVSSNAAIRLIESLQSDSLVSKRGKNGTEWSRLQGQNTMERLGQLQGVYAGASEDDHIEILKRIGGEAKMQPTIKAMLANNGDWQSTLQAMQGKINAPGSPEAMASWEQFQTDSGTGVSGVVGNKRMAETILADAAGDHVDEAVAVSSSDLLKKKMRQSGKLGQLAATAFETVGDKIQPLVGMAAAGHVPGAELANRVLTAELSPESMEIVARLLSDKSDKDQAFFNAVDQMQKAAADLAFAAEKGASKPQTRQDLD